MNKKMLGKIEKVHFGKHPDYPWFGFELTFGSSGWILSTGTKYYLELKDDYKEDSLKLLYFIEGLCAKAKVDDVYGLKGKPVEVEIEDQTFKSFRILEEVL